MHNPYAEYDRLQNPSGGTMTTAILSVTEWQNLLAALRTIVERYGLDAVAEATQYLENTRG